MKPWVATPFAAALLASGAALARSGLGRLDQDPGPTEKLLQALPAEAVAIRPQMSPGQLAMARAHVAWARRYAPHLLEPWLES